MKFYDWIVLAVFVAAIVVLAFFTKCSLDVYFIVLAAVVAVMAVVAFMIGRKLIKENRAEQEYK